MVKQRIIVILFCLNTVAAVSTTADDSLPHWIWSSSDGKRDQTCELQVAFPLKDVRRIQRCNLDLLADYARLDIIINEKTRIASLDAFAPMQSFDLTPHINNGVNTVTLRAVGTGGPSAIAARIHLAATAAPSVNLNSGPLWRSIIQGEKKPAVSYGEVSRIRWDRSNTAKITPFDDYEQWREASDSKNRSNLKQFSLLPGFEISLVRRAKKGEDSWVSMAIDAKNRITIAKEQKGLLRLRLNASGDRVVAVEQINDNLQEVRGLLYAYDSLYANANNSKGMYRLRDTDGDDLFDEVSLLRKFPGSVGHGRNDLALGPEGKIYSIHGDAVDVPTNEITDLTSPFRAARRGQSSPQGYLVRTDKDGKEWELIAGGLRNPFGIDFNDDGELFTYDADHEYDMGAPWYRPTRLVQLLSGADYGWRRVPSGEWPPYFPDVAEHALPVANIGKGSPTAVKSGRKSNYPTNYRQAIFALDWAYGRILACHLIPRGAGYVCRVEHFLKGRPLNVTDLDFAADGSMYFVTGGRKTQSALYRVRYVRKRQTVSPKDETQQQRESRAYAANARKWARSLESAHANANSVKLEQIWPHLGSQDPVLRNAARVALEHRSPSDWNERATAEREDEIAVTAALALAHSRSRTKLDDLLSRLNDVRDSELSAIGTLACIRAYRIALESTKGVSKTVLDSTRQRLLKWLNKVTAANAPRLVSAEGASDGVTWELGRLVGFLQVKGSITPLIRLLKSGKNQRERMHALYILCTQPGPWTLTQRQEFFFALHELERTAFSGAGMPGRLQQIRKFAIDGISDNERQKLGHLLEPLKLHAAVFQAPKRKFVRKWTVKDLESQILDSSQTGSVARGKKLFNELQCVACHRKSAPGGVLGPDLSLVANRFSQKDILQSIVTPSLVIAEKYRGIQVVTKDGKTRSGHIVTGGDYRSSRLRLIENPLQPDKITEIAKKDIETHRQSKISLMPEGLLDTLQVHEVLDLLAYLMQ